MASTDIITFRAIPLSEATMSNGHIAVPVEETGDRWGDELLAITLGKKPLPVHLTTVQPLRARDGLNPVEVETYRNKALYHLTGITLNEVTHVACFIQINGEARHKQLLEAGFENTPNV